MADLENPDAEAADREEVDLGDGETYDEAGDDLGGEEEDAEDDPGEEEEEYEGGDGEGEQQFVEGGEMVEEGEVIELDDELLDNDDIYPMQATEIYTEEEYAYMCDLPMVSAAVGHTYLPVPICIDLTFLTAYIYIWYLQRNAMLVELALLPEGPSQYSLHLFLGHVYCNVSKRTFLDLAL